MPAEKLLPLLLTREDRNFDATVLLVRADRLALAATHGADAVRRHPLRYQEVLGSLCPALRQTLVERVAAHGVRVTDDEQLGLGVIAQAVRQIRQVPARFAFDNCRV